MFGRSRVHGRVLCFFEVLALIYVLILAWFSPSFTSFRFIIVTLVLWRVTELNCIVFMIEFYVMCEVGERIIDELKLLLCVPFLDLCSKFEGALTPMSHNYHPSIVSFPPYLVDVGSHV